MADPNAKAVLGFLETVVFSLCGIRDALWGVVEERVMPPTDLNAANWAKLCAWMEPPPPAISQMKANALLAVRWWVPSYNGHPHSWGWIPTAQTLDDCALAEAEIEKRGLMIEYEKALILNSSCPGTPWVWRLRAYLIRLTPAQRTAAMVAVIEASR